MINSEDQLLAVIDRHFLREHGKLLLGRGDDCAELRAGTALALSTDLFLEDVHFRRSYFLPEEIGYKALAVNLSDLAAAGAVPAGFSLGLICAAGLNADYYDRIFAGMAELARKYDLPLSGGDISLGDKLGFSLTVWGVPSSGGDLVQDGGLTPEGNLAQGGVPTPEGNLTQGGGLPFLHRRARPGEYIFSLGAAAGYCALGLARNGLRQLEENGRAAEAAYPESCRALLRPQPQLEGGCKLALLASRHNHELGLMDLSDGLLRDLPRLLGGYGAALDFSADILHPELGEGALETALSGGDDYLLLGSCPASALDELQAMMTQSGLRLDILGEILPVGRGLVRGGKALKDFVQARSFDHFEQTP